MREQLLGYLLGALEEAENRQLEHRLATDTRLRRELALLRRSLQPLDTVRIEHAPPERLARRTCALIAARWQGEEQAGSEPADEPALAAAGRKPALAVAGLSAPEPVGELDGRSSWRLPDLSVAVAIALALVMLVIPAIQQSRFSGRVAACQDNLRQLGQALRGYSEAQKGYFPTVPAEGPMAFAGMYGPTLLSTGFLENSRRLLCPGSPLADVEDYFVPTVEEFLAEPTPQGRIRLRRWAGGSFGYGFGYWEDGRYHALRYLERKTFALMSDAPVHHTGGYSSLNHGGRGFNVLLESGTVIFVNSTTPNGRDDNIHLNDADGIGPGLQVNDAVISPSDTWLVLPIGSWSETR